MLNGGQPARAKEVADYFGVSPDALRHYERLRLLPPPARTQGGYRQYSPDAVKRIRIIRRALAIGFSLAEIGEILAVRDRGGAPCKRVHALAEEKLAQIEEEIISLTRARDGLRDLVAEWRDRLAATPQGKKAALLENGAGNFANTKKLPKGKRK